MNTIKGAPEALTCKQTSSLHRLPHCPRFHTIPQIELVSCTEMHSGYQARQVFPPAAFQQKMVMIIQNHPGPDLKPVNPGASLQLDSQKSFPAGGKKNRQA